MLLRLLTDLRRGFGTRERTRSAAAAGSASEDPHGAAARKKIAIYDPAIFDVKDIDSAMRIILTAESGTTTEERWQRETPYLVEEIGRALALNEASCVLDYGCGIGRIAKGLIERYCCSVLGIDISAGMRALAPYYVKSDRFAACAPEMLDRLITAGFRATHAYACWVIQHCAAPDEDLSRIEAALTGGARFFVLSSKDRWVPTQLGWANDGISIEQKLTQRFEVISRQALPAAVTTPELAACSFMMTLQAKPRSA